MNPITSVIAEGGWPGPLAAGACIALLPWLRRESTAARSLVIAVSIILMWRYIGWRWTASLAPVGLSADWIAGVIFAAVETAALFGTTLSLFFLTRVRSRSADVEANLGWLVARQEPPLIDVFICTYNEEEAILERTIVGALGMDYPNFRVWVLDDGRRQWLAALCERAGCGYITRHDNAHAKAGNINSGLAYVSRLAEPPDFVSILDADFVPFPNLLTRGMTLFRDETVGVVQTPQHFANPDPMQSNLSLAQVWPDEQRYFFDVIMPSKDAWGAAFCCGTSSIIRFSAVMRIGGFPVDSVTEDYLLTLRLRQIGFQTIYLNERLSLGLAPEGLREYIVQRSRWCLGFVQICVGASGPFRFGNGLSVFDRIILVETFLHWGATHLYKLLGLVIPIAYLLLGIEAVHADLSDTLLHFLPYAVVQMAVISWLSEWRVLPIIADLSQMLAATEIVKSVYRGLTKPKGQKFKVTAKGGDRGKLFVQVPLLSIFLTFLLLTVAGICFAFVLDKNRSLQESASLPLFWSWYNILVLTLACLVCVEQPRKRKADRFDTNDVANLFDGRNTHVCQIKNVSVTGACFFGPAPVPVGTELSLALGETRLRVIVVRSTAREFAVKIEDTFLARVAMIRIVYSGRHDAGVRTIEPLRVVSGLLKRVFR
jgi:cellulose synthase/poly-beta-1,6-N-acetylglucosamine synthase-like glycosyltransferase